METGIEAINFYAGSTHIDVRTLFAARGLDLNRFDNLMMSQKSVNLPCEDAVTNGVNAARPLIDALSDREKGKIELLISATESGVDFGKSLATYIHDYLGLSRNCRLFEVKQACYAGTAALHMANHFVRSDVSPGAKALVVATDVARAASRMTYAEPSQATGAVAMLVSDKPEILEIDPGAVGCSSYEVMDTCRPLPDMETGDSDLSLLSYLDCLESSFKNYAQKVEGADFYDTFDYLAFHTPFAGMVKGAHRKMMRQFKKASPEEISADFETRVSPSLNYCVRIGNVYSACIYFALCSLIDNAPLSDFNRVGFFSFGSGCASEFYSGIVTSRSKTRLAEMKLSRKLSQRHALSMEEYEHLLDLNSEWVFGIKDQEVELAAFSRIYSETMEGRGYLVLDRIKDYHREYKWS